MEATAHTPPEAWEPGEAVGQYTLLGRLAEGGMAEIWLARQGGLAGFQRAVVIKKISDALSEDEQFRQMFLDEARLAAQLTHSNIVQIYDLGENQGSYYIVMEYLHGDDLGMLVRRSVKAGRPLPITQAARILANAADGLAYAHDRTGLDGKPLNIVHRDVSPQNVLVTYDGGVKLLDFGIAKARSRAYRTMDGTIKGKVSYLSPEQARGEPLDCRSDVFSLGICLYEAIGRCRLFDHEDPHRNLLSIAGDSIIPPPSTLNPEVPPELDAIVMRALAKPLELRLPSARHLQVALEDWLRKRSDAPGSFEIAGTMRSLFGDRIAMRAKMIESAQRAGPAPTFAGVLLTETAVPATMIDPPPAAEVANQATVLKETPAGQQAPIAEGRVVAALQTVLLPSQESKARAKSGTEEDEEERILTVARQDPAEAPTDPVSRQALPPRVERVETNDLQMRMPAGVTAPPATGLGWKVWVAAGGVVLAGLVAASYLWLRS